MSSRGRRGGRPGAKPSRRGKRRLLGLRQLRKRVRPEVPAAAACHNRTYVVGSVVARSNRDLVDALTGPRKAVAPGGCVAEPVHDLLQGWDTPSASSFGKVLERHAVSCSGLHLNGDLPLRRSFETVSAQRTKCAPRPRQPFLEHVEREADGTVRLPPDPNPDR